VSEKNPAQPFLTHLSELRRRLLIALIFLVVVSSVCLNYAREIYDLLLWPLKKALPPGSYFITTHPIEAWFTYLKVALLAGFFISLPFTVYQLWCFAKPGLKLGEKKSTGLIVMALSGFFSLGAGFGYFVAFPLGFSYFASILQGTDIHFLPQMADNLTFVAQMLMAFGVIFELPVIVFFLGLSGLVTTQQLMSFQKYLIVLALTIAAILTPPDVASQLIMAIPMIALYQLGVLGVWVFARHR
jgi:sec-independent protein translocase protein TatC